MSTISTIQNQRFEKEVEEFISTLDEKDLQTEFKEVKCVTLFS